MLSALSECEDLNPDVPVTSTVAYSDGLYFN